MRCVLLVALVLIGCVDQGPGPQPKVDARYVRAHLLDAAPAGIDRFDITLGDKVIYLGNKVERQRVAPGAAVTITHYWKVLQPLGGTAGWRPFALVRGPAGSADFMNLEPTDMQVGHPPAAWKAGQIIEDAQTFTLRPDWRAPSATVLVGLIEVGRHGTLDRMAPIDPGGTRTRDRAIVAATLEIDLTRAPPPPGTIHVPRAQGAIAIDGNANDPGWSNAVVSPELVTAEGFREEPNGKATARMVWDDQYLYLFVSVVDTDVATTFQNHDDPMWKADCVEIFVDADGNRRGYIELQVNPYNATFDSWFAGPRGPAGDVTWDSGMVTQVQVRGTAAPGDVDQGWDAEIGIPWAAIKGRDPQMAVTIPPRIGDRWKLNVVRVDKRSGKDGVVASSWNRITYSDFHALDRMLVAVFADPTGLTRTPVEPAPGAGSAVVPPGSATAPGTTAPGTGSATAPGTTAPGTGSATAPGATAPGTGSATAPGTGSAIAPGTGSATAVRGTTATMQFSAGNAGAAVGSGSGAGSAIPAKPPERGGSGSARDPVTAPRAGSAGSTR